LLLKLFQKLQGQLIFLAERFLADDSLHGLRVTANGVFRILIDMKSRLGVAPADWKHRRDLCASCLRQWQTSSDATRTAAH
jgi:hypothetical protein